MPGTGSKINFWASPFIGEAPSTDPTGAVIAVISLPLSLGRVVLLDRIRDIPREKLPYRVRAQGLCAGCGDGVWLGELATTVVMNALAIPVCRACMATSGYDDEPTSRNDRGP